MTPTRDTRAGGVPLSTVAVVFEKHCDSSILAGKFELDHLSDRPKTQQLRKVYGYILRTRFTTGR